MKKNLLIIILCFIAHLTNGQNNAALNLSVTGLSSDSIEIRVEVNDVIWEWEVYKIQLQKGQYRGSLPVKKPSFFYIKDGTNFVHGFIEPGDSIIITYNAKNLNETLVFSGNKDNAMRLQNQLIQFRLREKVKSRLPMAKQTAFPFDHLLHYLDSLENVYLSELSQEEIKLSREAMIALSGFIKAQFLTNRYHSITLVHAESVDKTIEVRKNELTEYSLKETKGLYNFDDTYWQVSAYVNAIYGLLFRHYDGLLLDGKLDEGIKSKFEYINTLLPLKLRPPVLTMFLEYEMAKTNDASEIYTIIDTYFSNNENAIYNSYVNSKFQSLIQLKKGFPAPAFTLADEKGTLVNLEALRGKVVFVDFWFGSCAPCHSLFKKLMPVKEYFKDQSDVVFLNVSIDQEQVWRESLKKYQIHGLHVFTQNMGSGHKMIRDYKVVQYPTTFLIDKNGVIFSANPPDNPKELIEQIQQMILQ